MKEEHPKVSLNTTYPGKGGMHVHINVLADNAGEALDTFRQIMDGLPAIVDPVAYPQTQYPMALGACAGAGAPVEAHVGVAKDEPEKARRTRKPKDEPQEETAEDKAEREASVGGKAPEPEAPVEEDRTDLDEALRFITKQYENKDKRPVLKGLLTEFGVSKFGEITPARGAELLVRAKEVVAS